MRLILIDEISGFICGDTAGLSCHTFAEAGLPITQSDLVNPADAVLAARWMDEAAAGVFDREYRFLDSTPLSGSGYLVYRADVAAAAAVPPVVPTMENPYSRAAVETVEAVMRDCEYLGFVLIVGTGAGQYALAAAEA